MTLSTHLLCCCVVVCVVTQDLLILTIRQYCTKLLPDGTLVYPEWWLPCYDLSTEFHLFESDYRDRLTAVRNDCGSDSQACHSSWIVKPAGGTRALGHVVVTSADEAGLHRITALCPKVDILYSSTDPIIPITPTSVRPLSSPVGDKVAQLLIYRPLCVYEKKFDLRVFVLVRSFVPFEGKRGTYSDALYIRIADGINTICMPIMSSCILLLHIAGLCSMCIQRICTSCSTLA